ncbi:hypothetical protein [Rhizomonospora bruguierae]|uniref:hypothetical protein n=1 Tax=Rhizomonospora bruguierae TaxID=1581705 RepID=UPI001BCC142F|nr:hypothetical protein [Micromonospora sp. NBRC 107566]
MTVLAPASVRPSGRVAVGALARAEARLLLRSPLLWAGMVLSLALYTAWGWTTMPTWDAFAQNAGMASLVLAGALLLAGHLAASRDRRAGAESLETVPTTAARRGLGLLALVLVAGAAGASGCLAGLLVMLPAWPVGRFDPWALLVTVVVPAIGAALGIVVGRWLPTAAAGPLTVLAAAVVLGALPVLSTGADTLVRHLFPVPDTPWVTGAARPTGWHLVYLMCVLAAIVALLRWRHFWIIAIGVLPPAVATGAFATDQQARATPAVIYPEMVYAVAGPAVLHCETHGDVRYCALPHYGGWIPLWREAVEPVTRNLPAGATRPTVRQLAGMDDGHVLVPEVPEIATWPRWGRHGHWAEHSRTQLTIDYTTAATGLFGRGITPFDEAARSGCSGAGQHRTVVALWLLAQAVPDGTRHLADGGLNLGRVRYDRADAQAAAALLARPQDEVAAFLVAHWPQVMDPAGRALAPLGVTVQPPVIPAGGEPSDQPRICR